MDLTLDAQYDGSRTLVVLGGDLDLVSYRTLKNEVDRLVIDQRVDLVLDLDGLTFIDSLGLGALVSTRRKVNAFGGSLEIVCTNPTVMQVFNLTHLDRVFTILDTRPTGTAAPAPG
jgi:anti-sigma B factor antagonist